MPRLGATRPSADTVELTVGDLKNRKGGTARAMRLSRPSRRNPTSEGLPCQGADKNYRIDRKG